MILLILTLTACQGLEAERPEPRRERWPERQPEPGPRRVRRRVPPRPRSRRSYKVGRVRSIDGAVIKTSVGTFKALGPVLLEGVSEGDEVLMTLRDGVIILIDVRQKSPPIQARKKPKNPKVGELVEINQLRGRVLKSHPDWVVLNIWDRGRLIGTAKLPLRASTTLKFLDSYTGPAYAQRAQDRIPQDPMVAESIPKEGPLSNIEVSVVKPYEGLSMKVLAATFKDGKYGVTVLINNDSDKTLTGFVLNLDFRVFGKQFQFGELYTGKRRDRLPPRCQRRLSIWGKPLMGQAKAVRVQLHRIQAQ